VRIYPEEVYELVKLVQLVGQRFSRIDLFLVENEIILPFQLVTEGYLALGNLIALFAEEPVGNGSFALTMQHSKADFSLDGDRDCPYGIVDKAKADAAEHVGWPGMGSRGSSSSPLSSAMSGGFNLGISRRR
jgi:hypothetical protein